MVNNPNIAQKVITQAAKMTAAWLAILFVQIHTILMQGGKEAFEIPKYVGTNITFDREPMNAMEYLISVRNEASQIPDIVTISLDVFHVLWIIMIRTIQENHQKAKYLKKPEKVRIVL